MTTEPIENPIVEAIREHWGERCPDFDANCFCCKAWAEYDRLIKQSTASATARRIKCQR